MANGHPAVEGHCRDQECGHDATDGAADVMARIKQINYLIYCLRRNVGVQGIIEPKF